MSSNNVYGVASEIGRFVCIIMRWFYFRWLVEEKHVKVVVHKLLIFYGLVMHKVLWFSLAITSFWFL